MLLPQHTRESRVFEKHIPARGPPFSPLVFFFFPNQQIEGHRKEDIRPCPAFWPIGFGLGDVLLETFDSRVRCGSDKNQWAEGRAVGQYISVRAPRYASVLGQEQQLTGRRAGCGRVCFMQRPSLCGCVRGSIKLIWPNVLSRAVVFLQVPLDLRACWGRNKNQWAERQAAGGYISFKDLRFAGMLV